MKNNETEFCSSLFANLGKTEIGNLDRIRKHYEYRAGQDIPFQQDGRPGFFCIESGYVKLSYKMPTDTKAVRICGPGDYVGYGDWLIEHPHVAVALSPCLICFFDKELFLLVQNSSPAVSNEIIGLLCRTIKIKNQRILSLEKRSVKARVASTIAILNRKFGVPAATGSKLDLPIDRKTLAELSGTVVETLARILTELEDESVIRREGRYLTVTDLAKLIAACED